MKATYEFYFKHKRLILSITICLLLILFLMPFFTTKRVHLNSSYTMKEDVALYIKKYHELPPNYITKYGRDYLLDNPTVPRDDSYVIGGDPFYDTSVLSSFRIESDTSLKECDIVTETYDWTNPRLRGQARLLFSCNVKQPRVFYSVDHYDNFQELTSFKLQLPRNIFWIIFGVYAVAFVSFYSVCYSYYKSIRPLTRASAIKTVCKLVEQGTKLSKEEFECRSKCHDSKFQCGLYFLYDEKDVCIYVGMVGNKKTASLYMRMVGNGKDSHSSADWYSLVKYAKWHKFNNLTDEDIEYIERLAIIGMNQPVYNDKHTDQESIQKLPDLK